VLMRGRMLSLPDDDEYGLSALRHLRIERVESMPVSIGTVTRKGQLR
jgi:hypothetical protein